LSGLCMSSSSSSTGIASSSSTGSSSNIISVGAIDQDHYFLTGDISKPNPNMTLIRGSTYIFQVYAPGNPFWIKTIPTPDTNNAWIEGVTNNGFDVGTVTFDVPTDAPPVLYYQCQFHTIMTGFINIPTYYCLSSPCQNGGSCNNTIGGYTCTCTSNYRGNNCQTNGASRLSLSIGAVVALLLAIIGVL